jgi:hypothetical protein
MIERGNFEPLSPKKNLNLKTLKGLKDFDFNVKINCRRVNSLIMFGTTKGRLSGEGGRCSFWAGLGWKFFLKSVLILIDNLG